VYGALCRVRQSLTLHSALYTYYQGLDIICSQGEKPHTHYQGLDIIRSHISEQSTTTYFNRLFIILVIMNVDKINKMLPEDGC